MKMKNRLWYAEYARRQKKAQEASLYCPYCGKVYGIKDYCCTGCTAPKKSISAIPIDSHMFDNHPKVLAQQLLSQRFNAILMIIFSICIIVTCICPISGCFIILGKGQ